MSEECSNRSALMSKPDGKVSGALMLADHKGKTVDVICEDCEIFRRLDWKTLLDEHGNLAMPSLPLLIAKSLGCTRTENGFSNRCHLNFHFSPGEWAKRMGYVDPKARKTEAVIFSDLSEWHRLYAHCSCGRKTEVDRLKLERAVGKMSAIADAGKLLRCKKCGLKGTAKIVIVSASRG